MSSFKGPLRPSPYFALFLRIKIDPLQARCLEAGWSARRLGPWAALPIRLEGNAYATAWWTILRPATLTVSGDVFNFFPYASLFFINCSSLSRPAADGAQPFSSLAPAFGDWRPAVAASLERVGLGILRVREDGLCLFHTAGVTTDAARAVFSRPVGSAAGVYSFRSPAHRCATAV